MDEEEIDDVIDEVVVSTVRPVKPESNIIRSMVRGAYDIQRLRIQMGLRIVANWKAKLGIAPSTKEAEAEEKVKKLIDTLRESYKKLTDGVKVFPKKSVMFVGDDLISSYTELSLLRQYVDLEKNEANCFNDLEKALSDSPIYTEFLTHVAGCGPAMSGVIVSEIDIHKAKYPSSLWQYAGVNVVSKWLLQGTTIKRGNLAKKEPVLSLPIELDRLEDDERCIVDGGVIIGRQTNVQYEAKLRPHEDRKGQDLNQTAWVLFDIDGYEIHAEYRQFAFGGQSRKKEHLVDVKYIDKDGKEQVRKGINYNPFLKTKLMGVLSSSLLRTGLAVEKEPDRDKDGVIKKDKNGNPKWRSKKDADGDSIAIFEQCSKYAKIYLGYKNRLKNKQDHWKDESKGHRHWASLRYMIKRFLVDLYVAWRTMEKLPVAKEYAEAKLGIVHGQPK